MSNILLKGSPRRILSTVTLSAAACARGAHSARVSACRARVSACRARVCGWVHLPAEAGSRAHTIMRGGAPSWQLLPAHPHHHCALKQPAVLHTLSQQLRWPPRSTGSLDKDIAQPKPVAPCARKLTGTISPTCSLRGILSSAGAAAAAEPPPPAAPAEKFSSRISKSLSSSASSAACPLAAPPRAAPYRCLMGLGLGSAGASERQGGRGNAGERRGQ